MFRRMRSSSIVLTALMLVTSCGDRTEEPVGTKLTPGLTVIMDESHVSRPFGTGIREMPPTRSQEEADRVYEETLTEACATLETRIVEGPVLRDGRTCTLLSVDGLIPRKTLLYQGFLRSSQGETLEVAWVVSEGSANVDTDLAAVCRMDPTQGKSGPWILSRNGRDRLWMVAPKDEWIDPRWTFSPDGNREACATREASASRVQALVARQRAQR